MRKKSYAMLMSLPVRLVLSLQIRSLTLFAILCGLAVMIFATAGRAQESAATPRSGGEVNTVQQSEPLAASVPPSPLLPPEQVRPSAPQVSYDGKQLTIIADNSTLSDILAAVRARTGAEIDVPTSASGERLAVVRLGPGPAREVLASLLSWTDFDYIIQASVTNPQGIQSVLLVARIQTAAAVATVRPAALASQPRLGANRRVAEPNPSTAETPEPENPVPPQQGISAEVAPADLQPARLTPESNATNQSRLRTSQQMIQELQSLYQQRLQIPKGQRPPTPTRPLVTN